MSINRYRRLRLWRFCLLVVLPSLIAQQAGTAHGQIQIPNGKGEFRFVDRRGDPSKVIPVFTYLPENLKASEARIVFVMHGHHRSAEGYRNDWAKHADHYGFMVLAPLFDLEQWGHGQYTYASVVTKSGKIRNPAKWSFSVIEHLFDAVKEATGNTTPRYYIWGFSEGGQFVHRFVLMMPGARYAKAVVGTPGWYTMPRFDVQFPYGLRGSPVTPASLKVSLGRNVVLLLGDADTDPNHEELLKTPEAEAQGPHRVSRGKKFFQELQRAAAALKTPLGWRILMVPGAAHQPSKMSPSAAALLMAP
jgi:poly(3-hydroxybutyrate) depolymerase